MRLCAEALFALNAAIDTGLLACSARLCGQKLFWRRLIAAGCLGGVYAVAAVLPELGFLRSGLVKLCAAVGMCLLSFGAGRYLARLTAAFCAMGCVFAGAVTAFTQLTGTGLMRVPGDGYYPVSALALCAIGALCVAVCRLFFSACAQHSARSFEQLTLRLEEREITLRALVDTGNALKDPITNEPVFVLDWQAAARLLPGVALSDAQAGFTAQLDERMVTVECPPELLQRLSREKPSIRLRLIPYRAVGVRQGMLLAVRCERKGKNGRYIPALAAFSPTPVSGGGEYEALTGGAA